MNTVVQTAARSVAIVALVGLSLTACGRDAPEPKEETSVVASAVNEAVSEAREEIRTGNITVSHDHGEKKAEITPKGDLLLDGKPVAVNAQQRALLLEYREQVAKVAESGMQIGVQGAGLAAKAMGEAFKGIFSGKTEQEIEKSVEAEATKIKAAAAQLCLQLPGMMDAQQKLAAALPEFRPYADMTQADIDDCLKDADERAAEVGKEVSGAAKDVAGAAQDAADAANEAAAAAGEAADAAKEAADAAKEAADAATN